MKYLLSFVLLSLSAYGVRAGGLDAAPIRLVHLLDGRSIDLQHDAEWVHFYDGRLDYIELVGGEIVDRTDIAPPNDHIHFRSGGTGGGG